MPWIKKEMCTGCGACVDECSVGAITMEQEAARIDENECIRCGVCHEACPVDAVRHDGERIPEEVRDNMAYARKLMNHKYYRDDEEKRKQLLERLRRLFTKNKTVAEKTVEQLENLRNAE